MSVSFKGSLFGLTVVTALAVTGCNKQAPTEKAVDEQASSEVTDTTQVTKDTKAVDTIDPVPESSMANDSTSDTVTVDRSSKDFTIARLTTDMINNLLFVPLIKNGGLTTKQIACLEDRDKDLVLVQAQEFYKDKFSSAELDSLNEFYSSPIGKKFIAFGNEQLLLMNGIKTDTQLTAPSDAELKEMKAFMETPVGQKYQHVNNAEGYGSLLEVIRPTVASDLKRCEIDGMP